MIKGLDTVGPFEVTVHVFDEVNCTLEGIPAPIRRLLHDACKIFKPDYRFSMAFKTGRFDGKVSFFSIGGQTYLNLLPKIMEVLDSFDVQYRLLDYRTAKNITFTPIDDQYFASKVWPSTHELAGKPVILRPHQVVAINKFFENPQGIESLPTGSGKSLITAVLSHAMEPHGRTIVIVPSKDLITQTEKYYIDLGLDVGVYYGDRKDFGKTHTISTWQSLNILKNTPLIVDGEEVNLSKYVEKVQAVIVDEAHQIKGDKLRELLTGPFAHIPIRWALTGTIPKPEYDRTNLTISIGDVIHKLETVELQDIGVLSNCDINILQLIDNVSFYTYREEHHYLTHDSARLAFLSKLFSGIGATGNVLILVQNVATGKLLEKSIPGSVFLSGVTKSKTRKQHYSEVATTDNKILIATAGIAAVGLDIPRLHHLVLFELGKSFIRTVQSIGRVLRTAFDKNHATVWDIASTTKYSKKHLTERKKYYREQKFPHTIKKIDWKA